MVITDPRLARIYDAFDGERHDLPAYLGIIEELGARRVLDIGCGTGCLAVRLAERGIEVVGVDPSGASVAVARTKEHAGKITWVVGGVDAAPDMAADLAVMTGNVAQVFGSDESWHHTLDAIHARLRPGGHLVFETRRPARKAWVDWAKSEPVTLDIPGIGAVREILDVTEVALPFVSFRHTYHFPDGETRTEDSRLRFRDEDELRASLTARGYRVVDVREAPDRPGREFVFIAERISSPTGDMHRP